MSALGHKQTFRSAILISALSPKTDIATLASRRAPGDDVDDLERHHYFAGLIDDLDERGDRAAASIVLNGAAVSCQAYRCWSNGSRCDVRLGQKQTCAAQKGIRFSPESGHWPAHFADRRHSARMS